MNKLALLCIFFCNLFNGDLATKLTLDNNEYEFIEEYDESNLEIIEEIDGVKLAKLEEKYKLIIKEKEIVINGKSARITIFKENVYVFYLKGEKLFYSSYDSYGNLIDLDIEVSTTNITDFIVSHNDDDLYCAYTSYNSTGTDAWVKSITRDGKIGYLMSIKNEEIKGLVVDENAVYALVKKDAITEGVLGNGGTTRSHVIVKLSLDLSIIDYITIDYSEEVDLFTMKNEYLYLSFAGGIHIYNKDLTSINYKNIGNNLLTIVGENDKILVIFDNMYQVFNAHTLALLAENSHEFNLSNIYDTGSYLMMMKDDKYYKGDLIDLSKSVVYDYFNISFENKYDEALNNIYSLYGKLEVENKDYNEYYNRGVYGDYNINILYKTKSNIKYNRSYVESIPLDINFRDQMIYPTGYRVLFNGEGYLDGNGIVSNYAITEEGKHTLVIKGANKESTFIINISNSQMEFSDYNRMVFSKEVNSKELYTKESFTIIIDLSKEIAIKKINYEGGTLDKYELVDNKLFLTFSGYKDSGYYDLFLDSIVYEDKVTDEIKYDNVLYINKLYSINVYEDSISSENRSFDGECNFTFDVVGRNSQARYVQFELVNNKGNYVYIYPLGDSRITFSNINSGSYELICYLVYDIGREKLEYIKLYDYPVIIKGDCFYGDIVINSRSATYSKFTIDLDDAFKNNSVSSISYDKELVYSKNEVIKENVKVYSIVVTILSILLGIFIRFVIKKYKKKESNNSDIFS